MVDNEPVVFTQQLHFISQHESQLLPVRFASEREQEGWSVLGKVQSIPLL